MKCVKCGRRAAFISPIGTMCPTGALLAAAFHDWIPAQIRSEDRLGSIPPGYLRTFSTGEDLSGPPSHGTDTRTQLGRPPSPTL